MVVVSPKSNLGCEAGCGLTASWSDRGRIMLSDRPRIVNNVFANVFIFAFWTCHFSWRAQWKGTSVAPRIVNDVSCVVRLKNMVHFTCQAQHLVRLEGDTCCSAHCRRRFICDEM